MDSKERRILRNRASAERSRKNKDVLIDSLRQSIATYDHSIQDLRVQVANHPHQHLLSPYQPDLSPRSSAIPFYEPAVFAI